MAKGFIEFIRGQGVIGLAIGLVLGSSVTALVKSLVDNIINPIIGLILSSVTLDQLSLTLIEKTETSDGLTLQYGAFISSLIDFLIIAAVVFYVFKGLRLDRLDKKEES